MSSDNDADAAESPGLTVAEILARNGVRPGSSTPHHARADPEEAGWFSDRPVGEEHTDPLFAVGTIRAGPDDHDDFPTDVVPTVAEDGPPANAEPDAEPEPEPEPEPEQPVAVAPEHDDESPIEGRELRSARIDESLTRLTAIHAGLGSELAERVSRTGKLPVVPAEDEDEDGADAEGENAAQPPRGPGWASTPGRRRAMRLGKALAAACALVLFVFSAAGWGTKLWLDTKLRTVAALDPSSDAIVDPAAQVGDENFLLVGYDEEAMIASDVTGSGTPVSTVMVAHVPAEGDRVVLMSFPGDLQVDRPFCDRWDPAAAAYPGGTAVAETGVPLATAFEVGGPRCLTKVIQQVSGLAVNHYTGVDLVGLTTMVDAVDGVPMCVPGAGPTVVTGEQALEFLRADPGESPALIQHRFVSALLRKGVSDDVLSDPGRLNAFVSAFGSHSRGDNAGIDELSTLAGALASADADAVTFVTVPNSGDATALFDAVRAGKPLPGSGIDDSTRPPALVAPSEVTLTVLNGSEQIGLANQVGESLTSLGFTVEGLGDAPGTEGGETFVRYPPDRERAAESVAAAVPAAVLRPETGPLVGTGVVELVLGDGFDGVVRAAPASTATTPTTISLAALTGPDGSCG